MTTDNQAPPTFRQSIEWIAGPAQGNSPSLYDGEQYLCAIQVNKGWEMAVVTVAISGEPDDEDEGVVADFEIEGEIWGRDWSEVVWYVPIKFLCPPMQPVQEKTV